MPGLLQVCMIVCINIFNTILVYSVACEKYRELIKAPHIAINDLFCKYCDEMETLKHSKLSENLHLPKTGLLFQLGTEIHCKGI